MELNKDNIGEWLDELNKLAEPYFGKRFSRYFCHNTEWFEDYEGWTPKEVVDEEISCCAG